MADATVTSAVLAADLRSLDLLFDYTKFHIGLYLSLSSAFITVASVKRGETFVLNVNRNCVWLAIAGFMVAGFAGGVIASSITQCFGYVQSTLPGRCSSTEAFLGQRLGPMEVKWFFGRTWTQIEHGAFWFGLLMAAASFLTARSPAPAAKLPIEVKLHGPIELKNVV